MKEPVLEPSIFGGGMVVDGNHHRLQNRRRFPEIRKRNPQYRGGDRSGVAAEYLQKVGMEKIRNYEEGLTNRLIDGLAQIKHVHVFVLLIPPSQESVLSHSLLMACIRMKLPSSLMRLRISWCDPGHHCCQPLTDYLKLPEGTVRASLAIYNTDHEIDMLLATLEELAR